MRTGTDLIVGGEVILSGDLLLDEYAAWMWEGDVYFTPRMVREALAQIGGGPVTVRLSCFGGHAHAGEAIRAILAAHPGGATIVVEGIAASAASLLLMGGAQRQITEGSLVMIHNPSSAAWGEQEDLRREADVLEKLSGVYAAVYARASGQSVEAVRAIMDATTWYSAEDAVAAGFCDAVVASDDAETSPAPFMPAIASADAARAAVMTARQSFEARLTRNRPAAPVGAQGQSAAAGGFPAPMATTQESDMPVDTPAQMAAVSPVPVAAQTVGGPSGPSPEVMAERTRVAAIHAMAQPYVDAGRLQSADVVTMIADGLSSDAAAARMLSRMAADEPAVSRTAVLGRGMDETETRRMGMEGALVARLSGAAPADVSRPYMEMSITDMAAERMGLRRVPSAFGQREDIVRMAFHTTSDFPILFENSLNRTISARYALAMPTYRRIARQRSYADFRAHTTVRVGDFPNLKPVNPEGGELKGGTFSESKETTSVTAYGVQVAISRAMLVNDSLDGLSQVLNDRGAAVARFEEQTFYAMMLGGANADGPTLLETTRQVFNTTDVTKAGTAAAITVTSVGVGTAALMSRTGKDEAKLGLFPSILLTGPAKWLEASQLIAPVAAAQTGNVNPFSGRLSVESTPWITGNAWYLFADTGAAPCFEWGLLEGYEAPRFRIEDVFGSQGTKLSLEHDFGCGAIDFRGGFKNAGA